MKHHSMRKNHLRTPWGLAFTAGLALLMSMQSAEARKPNIVFFLVDDLGYMDVGANNPKTFYETPNIDLLAQQGMRFTDGYAANPVCSPTRYSIMTGKYPSHARATNWFSGKREGRYAGAPLNDFMAPEEITLAESLKRGGYRTAFLGKWHLGGQEEHAPENQGFEINMGGIVNGSPPGGYFSPYKNPKLPNGPAGEHLPGRLADEAVKVIDQFQEQPFLLYLSFYSVHTPLQGRPELIEKYKAKAAKLAQQGSEFADEEQAWPVDQPRKVRVLQQHPVYAAMVESMDSAVGKVLAKIKEAGLEEDTIVVFTADNGGLSTAEGSPTSNLPLRGGKGWVYEGGIREAFMIKWPKAVKPGTVSNTPASSIDFHPTLLDLAGVEPAADQRMDGVSLAPVLRQTGDLNRDALFWHYPHYSNQGGFPGGAVRMGDFKLVERYEDGRVHLYNLRDDVGETKDLAQAMPEKVEAMRKRLHAWYREVDAQFLTATKNGPQPWRP